MVLILTGDGDYSSDIVMDWLSYYNHPFLRINTLDMMHKKICVQLCENDIKISFDKYELSTEVFPSIWFRKFGMWSDSQEYTQISDLLSVDNLKFINAEFNRFIDVICNKLKDSYWITSPYRVSLNKYLVLREAMRCGLSVPDSYIVNTKSDLLNKKLISKSLFDPIIVNHSEFVRCMMYTTPITESDMEALPEMFFPSLVQNQIDKDFEVRIFYLEGNLYSMAIFSQQDESTKMDFRNYNKEKPNRFVPFRLPKVEESKIKKLMHRIKLNCGSIDMIKSKDGQYYFLEVNPVGQFGMVSDPCNYNLHKIIAETLISHDNNAKR